MGTCFTLQICLCPWVGPYEWLFWGISSFCRIKKQPWGIRHWLPRCEGFHFSVQADLRASVFLERVWHPSDTAAAGWCCTSALRSCFSSLLVLPSNIVLTATRFSALKSTGPPALTALVVSWGNAGSVWLWPEGICLSPCVYTLQEAGKQAFLFTYQYSNSSHF